MHSPIPEVSRGSTSQSNVKPAVEDYVPRLYLIRPEFENAAVVMRRSSGHEREFLIQL